MCKIKLIAFDLDGTILEEGEFIPEETKTILTKIAQEGIKLATASGRPLEQQYHILKINELGPSKAWPHALIVNESEIYLLNKNSYESLESWNDKIRKMWMKAFPKARGLILKELRQLRQKGVVVQRHITDEEVKGRLMIDLLFGRLEDARASVKNLSKQLLNYKDELWCNRNYCLMQVSLRQAGKGNTVFALAHHFGLAPEEVLVIGDSGNDISMLDGDYRFRLATVSNAEAEVKKSVKTHGGYIASKPRSKGVIEIVKKMIFRRKEDKNEKSLSI